jgi:hypothetical protein
MGTQVCVLNPLVEVSDWLHYRQFDSGKDGFSWTNHNVSMVLYTILSDQVIVGLWIYLFLSFF